jgi:hypothetical protein
MLDRGIQAVQSGALQVDLELTSRGAYLRAQVPVYPAEQFINLHTPGRSRIMFIDAGRSTYYLHRPEFHNSVFEDWTIAKIAGAAGSPQEIGKRLKQMGISYLLVGPGILVGQDTSPFLGAGEAQRATGERLSEFLQASAQQVWSGADGYAIYKLP